jgi:hypothetical protein
VVSNDSDLLTPIRMAQQECGLVVGLMPPRPNGSVQLKNLANFIKPIRPNQLLAAQFPTALKDASGTVTKPQAW